MEKCKITLSTEEIKYKAYLLKWLFGDMESIIDTKPDSFEKFCKNNLNKIEKDDEGLNANILETIKM